MVRHLLKLVGFTDLLSGKEILTIALALSLERFADVGEVLVLRGLGDDG